MQMQVSPEKLPAVTPFPSPKRFQIDESPPYVEFPVLVRWQHRGEGGKDTWPYIIPVEGRDFIAFQFQPKWLTVVDGH